MKKYDEMEVVPDKKNNIELFSPRHKELFQKILELSHKSMVINDPNNREANTDFMLIGTNIETTRAFNIKVSWAAGLSYEIKKKELLFSKTEGDVWECIVRVTDPEGRFTEGSGSCSVRETKLKNAKNGRVMHDAGAIAETRALKRAVEAAVGLPLINMIIKEIFSGYKVTPKQARGVNYDKQIKNR